MTRQLRRTTPRSIGKRPTKPRRSFQLIAVLLLLLLTAAIGSSHGAITRAAAAAGPGTIVMITEQPGATGLVASMSAVTETASTTASSDVLASVTKVATILMANAADVNVVSSGRMRSISDHVNPPITPGLVTVFLLLLFRTRNRNARRPLDDQRTSTGHEYQSPIRRLLLKPVFNLDLTKLNLGLSGSVATTGGSILVAAQRRNAMETGKLGWLFKAKSMLSIGRPVTGTYGVNARANQMPAGLSPSVS